MKHNPFLISGYMSPEYFCNRNLETDRIINSCLNQRNITLISSRRMGKTGLIFHSFYQFNEKNDVIPVYLDILSTTNLKEFTEALGNALLTSLAKTESGLKKFIKQFSHLRPELSFNPFSGEPKMSLGIRNSDEALSSLEAIFHIISERKTLFIIAIDEFQQIMEYPEKNIEAILRTHIQQLGNSSFIFSGSKKHLLSNMFSKPSRPFFSSTEMLFLNVIDKSDYTLFIENHFYAARKSISPEAIEKIFLHTGLHTFYTQLLCNRLYSLYSKITEKDVEKLLLTILQENQPVYANYLNLLTSTQYKVLRAIALEGEVSSPNAKDFLRKHELGAASTVSQAVDSLIEKEFITRENNTLSLQDKFLREWIRMKSL